MTRYLRRPSSEGVAAGHTELLSPSRCAQDYVAADFIDGTMPAAATECQQDDPPFSS